MPQQQEHRLGRPVQVVEHQHQGLGAGQLDQPRGRGLEEQVFLRPRVRRNRDPDAWRPNGEKRLQAGQFRRMATEHRFGCVPRVPVQSLDERLVRNCDLLVATPVEHDRPLVVGCLGHLRSGARLPHAGLPGQQHRPAAAGCGLPARFVQLGQKIRTPDVVGRPRSDRQQTGEGHLHARDGRAHRLSDPLELRHLSEDVGLQPAQRRTGVDAQLLRQGALGRLKGAQRLRLAAAAVEGQHQQAPQRLSQGIIGDESLEATCQLGVPSEGELGLGVLLDRHQPKLLQPGGLDGGEVVVGEVGRRRSSPQGKRFGQGPAARWASPAASASLPSPTSRSNRAASMWSGSTART